MGLSVFDVDNIFEKICATEIEFFVAIGYKNMRKKKGVFQRLKQKGIAFSSIISPDACIHKSAKIGSNCFIMPGVVIEPGVIIGDNNIIWSNVTICHDAKIGSHNFIAVNSTIGGFSVVGDSCFLGFSSVIIQSVILQNEVLLGANSLLVNNADECCKYLGSPAKRTHCHKESGICI